MAKGKQYIIVLSELLRRAIPLDAAKALQYDAMTLAQSTLLLNVSLVLLRIDRGLDSALEQQWIAGNPDCRPYLTGVGLLLEPGASTRLLRECQRILKSYDAWPHLRAGFILALNELVEEVNPLTDAPYSWAS
ncbi:hypothetical protein APSETT445_001771 [Aspergillus pseudonomiae]